MVTPSSSPSPGLLTETIQTVAASGPPVKVEMVLRIWSPGSRESETAPSEHTSAQHPGLFAFIEDVVASKHGVFQDARNQLYVSGLKRPTDALVIARRIQLGLKGFRAKQESVPVAISIAIDSSNQAASKTAPDSVAEAGNDSSSVDAPQATTAGPSHDLLTLLKLSRPAQVLITHDLCQRSTAIKCLPLKSFPGRFGVYEYLWTSPETLDLLQSEPQLTLLTVPSASVAEPSAEPGSKTSAKPAGQTIAAETVAESPVSQIRAPEMVRDWRAAFRSPRFATFAGLAVVVIAIGSFVGVRLARESSSHLATKTVPISTQPTSPAAEKTTSAATPSSPSQTSTADSTNSNPPATSQRGKPATQQTPRKAGQEKHASSPAPSAECILPGELSRFVALAEQARGRGDYANAIRRFHEILACDPNNGAARDGLNHAIQGQEQSRHQ
jgi:hypothetical protein